MLLKIGLHCWFLANVVLCVGKENTVKSPVGIAKDPDAKDIILGGYRERKIKSEMVCPTYSGDSG
ncbi:hypothetical protein PMI07_005587 [Rhizobium sp. CF080]|nr:hypothetical protein PMI07_005587 [Rhizobium sp. CF080]